MQTGDIVIAEGYGRVTVGDIAEFDTLIEIVLTNGESAWTDSSLVTPLDS